MQKPIPTLSAGCLVVLVLAAHCAAIITPVSPDSEEFRRELAPHVARVEDVIDLTTLKVHRLQRDPRTGAPRRDRKGQFLFEHGSVEANVRGIASETEIKGGRDRDHPLFTKEELRRVNDAVPLLRNAYRLRLVGTLILLRNERPDGAGGQVSADVHRLEMWRGGYVFPSWSDGLIDEGRALPSATRWDVARDTRLSFDDVQYLYWARQGKRGLWCEPAFQLAPGVVAANVLPLERVQFSAPTGVSAYSYVTVALSLPAGADGVLSREHEAAVNRYVKRAVESLSADELLSSRARKEIEDDVFAMVLADKALVEKLKVHGVYVWELAARAEQSRPGGN
jgi:hypothetical protein